MKHLKNHWTSKAIHSPITFTLRFCVWSAMRKIYVFVLFCFFVEKFWRNQWKTVILEILGNMDWIKQLVPWTLCSLISIHVYETLDMFWKVTISASFKKMYFPKISEGHLGFNLIRDKFTLDIFKSDHIIWHIFQTFRNDTFNFLNIPVEG